MTKAQVFEPISMQSEGYKIPQDLSYVRLPVLRKMALGETAPAWRLVLVSLDQSSRPLGLQIDSEITIGRAREIRRLTWT